MYDESSIFSSGGGNGGPWYDEASNKEIERYVENSFERARIEAERTFFNQQILESPTRSAVGGTVSSSSSYDPFSEVRRGTPIAPGAKLNQPLDFNENVFAKKVFLFLVDFFRYA